MTGAEGSAAPRLVLADVADASRRDLLHNHIRQFNDLVSPYHRAYRPPGKIRPLDIYLLGDQDELVGGLASDTYWDWWYIDHLWVRVDLRHRGFGRRMMLLAEAEAQRRGARHAHLRTFSFQAPLFYQGLGFKVVGQLDDYPPGATFYWLRKDLLSNADGATMGSV